MLGGDDVPVPGSSDENVGARSGILHRSHLVAGHSGLKRVDRVDLGDEHSCSVRAQRFGALRLLADLDKSVFDIAHSLADIAKPGNDSYLPCEHDIRSTLDPVDERLSAPVLSEVSHDIHSTSFRPT